MYRHEGFVNPYGEEWFMAACNHQYSLGEAYENGYNACVEAILKLVKEKALVDILEEKNGD